MRLRKTGLTGGPLVRSGVFISKGGRMQPVIRSFHSALLFFALCTIAALHLEAQAAPQAPAGVPAPNRITLDVFVADTLGHPVRGLTEQQFTVLDNGQARPLVGFRAVDPTTDPDAVRVLVVIDMTNQTVAAVAEQRQRFNEFLNEDGGRLAHPTSIAVMTETGVKMMQGYSQDGHLLLASFDKVNNELRAVGRSAGFYGAAERLTVSLSGLNQIADFEATQPGRKLVMIIGPGWPLLPRAGIEESDRQRAWSFDAIVALTNKLRESHVALYSIDPFILGATDPFYYKGYLKPVKKPVQAEYPYRAQQVFAEHSGGRALTNGNDVVGSLNAALRDAGAYYELTFEAPAPDQKNEFHELRVQTTAPNASVRTNAFYYANPTSLAGKNSSPDHAAR